MHIIRLPRSSNLRISFIKTHTWFQIFGNIDIILRIYENIANKPINRRNHINSRIRIPSKI